MPRFKVEVRWHARAVIVVDARNAQTAEKAATALGLPWENAEEADDGDGYEVNVLGREEE